MNAKSMVRISVKIVGPGETLLGWLFESSGFDADGNGEVILNYDMAQALADLPKGTSLSATLFEDRLELRTNDADIERN